jgi:tetratricopeptide (TPR) repeat protein
MVEPLLSTRVADYQKDLAAAAAYILKHPEQVPMALWHDYRFPLLRCEPEAHLPAQQPWFRTVSPPGTAHDPSRRIRFDGIKDRWTDHLAGLHAIDPWNPELCNELCENREITAESVREIWGSISDYSALPMRLTLRSTSLGLEDRIATLRKLSEIDPETGSDLGEVLVIAGRPDEAIKAFEHAFQNAADRVSVANSCQWMIHHYKQSGDDKRAHEVADDFVETFSHRGLMSAMTLAIVEKDAGRAVSLAKQIHERYDDPLIPCYAGWLAEGRESDLKRVFPEGLATVTASDFQPREAYKGVRFIENSAIMFLNQVRCHDIVLAVDGIRVETFAQYLMLMTGKLDPKVKFIIKRGTKILEIDCILPNRRFSANMLGH